MMKQRIRLVLADKNKRVRSTVRSVLSRLDFIDWVGEADDRDQLVSIIEQQHPSVVLTEIDQPQQSCLDAIEQFHILYPATKFIFLTAIVEPELVIRAVRGGLQGFLAKPASLRDLAQAIRTVHQGGKYFSQEIAVILANALSNPEPLQEVEMSDREKTVLRMVSSGNSSRKIADMLAISIRTVEAHRLRLLKRFGVSNTAQLIVKSSQYHLL